jgi:hypothetical protein
VLALNSGRVYWGAAGVMLVSAPLVGVFAASVLRLWPLTRPGAEPMLTQTAAVMYLWLWAALAMFFARNSRKRLADFSPIAGVIAGGIFALVLLAALAFAGMFVWGFLFA